MIYIPIMFCPLTVHMTVDDDRVTKVIVMRKRVDKLVETAKIERRNEKLKSPLFLFV